MSQDVNIRIDKTAKNKAKALAAQQDKTIKQFLGELIDKAEKDAKKQQHGPQQKP